MKTIRIQAGQSTKIISRFSNSIPTTFQFTATSTSINQQPSGTIEIKGSNWLFPKPPAIQALQSENTVSKTMWDTFFSVHVTPDQEVNITLENGQMSKPILLSALVIGILGVAASFMIIGMK